MFKNILPSLFLITDSIIIDSMISVSNKSTFSFELNQSDPVRFTSGDIHYPSMFGYSTVNLVVLVKHAGPDLIQPNLFCAANIDWASFQTLILQFCASFPTVILSDLSLKPQFPEKFVLSQKHLANCSMQGCDYYVVICLLLFSCDCS